MNRWIDLDGAVNVRDVGGLPTRDGGFIQPGRLLRSDNLQGLTAADVSLLTGDLGLRDVLDLRTSVEVSLEGPGPLVDEPGVTIHHLSLLAEGAPREQVPSVDGATVMPWKGRTRRSEVADKAAGFYLNYLYDRPDSIVAALRVIGTSDGSAIVHCAAGKDRTGVVIAFALDVSGVERSAIVDDFALTSDRVHEILARLTASPTYAADLDGIPVERHLAKAETMDVLLKYLDDEFGGVEGWLTTHGWTSDDTNALRTHLVDHVK